MSEYVDQGIIKEFHLDSNTTSYAERVSFGSTSYFTIRASAASGLTTGYTTSSTDFYTPPWARGIEVYGTVSAVASNTSGAAAITYEIRPKAIAGSDYLVGGNPSSAKWLGDSTAAGSSAGTTGATRLVVYPNIAFSSGYQYNGVLPQIFRVDSILAGSSMNFTWNVVGRFIP